MAERLSTLSVKDSDEERYVDLDSIDEGSRYISLKTEPVTFSQKTVTLPTITNSTPPITPTRTSTVGPNTKMTSKDICIRLKQHGFSIIAFSCGVILTVVILIPILVTRSCNDDTDYKFDLKFDRSSMHSALFVSDDNSILSNVVTSDTPNSVSNSEQFKSYKGALGSRCFTKTDRVYYKVEFIFTLTSSLSSNSSLLVVEIGLVDPDKADNHHYVGGSEGWSYYIHNCVQKICLTAEQYSKGINENIKTISLSNVKGTTATGSLGFFVNMNRNEFSIVDIDTVKILYTFDKVTAPNRLCPVFAVYNPHKMEVKLELMYAYDFKTIPIMKVIA